MAVAAQVDLLEARVGEETLLKPVSGSGATGSLPAAGDLAAARVLAASILAGTVWVLAATIREADATEPADVEGALVGGAAEGEVEIPGDHGEAALCQVVPEI